MASDLAAPLDHWRAQLLDTTKRNRLIHCRLGRSGGIPLVSPGLDDLWQRLIVEGKTMQFVWKEDLLDRSTEPRTPALDDVLTLPLDEDLETAEPSAPAEELELCLHSRRYDPRQHILTAWTDRQLGARLTRLALKARESLSEQGVVTLFLVFGVLRWFESPESEGEILSPLLLVPATLQREAVGAPWLIRADEEELVPNYTLAQRLHDDFRLSLPLPDEREVEGESWQPHTYFSAIEKCGQKSDPRWKVVEHSALGSFPFQKLAMWEDLGRNRPLIVQHELCRALAGDSTVSLATPAELPDPTQLDATLLPDQTYQILDADSSQQAAILAATRGANLILDGPPGTGKSQTIANIIAELLANGKTILFVSEKTAALEVVKRRLDERGLGDFCLELHSSRTNKRAVIEELGRVLQLTSENDAPIRDTLKRLYELRRNLNDYVHELHRVHEPLGCSVFQAQGALARLRELTRGGRCTIPDVRQRNSAYLREWGARLDQLPSCGNVLDRHHPHPWRGCRVQKYQLGLPNEIHHHLEALAGLVGEVIPLAQALVDRGFPAALASWPDWEVTRTTVNRLLAGPLFPPCWFARDAATVARTFLAMEKVTQKLQSQQTLRAGLSPAALEYLTTLDRAPLHHTLQAERSVLGPQERETIAELQQRQERAHRALTALHVRLRAVAEREKTVRGLLPGDIPMSAIGTLNDLCAMTAQLIRYHPLKPGWLEEQHRHELESALQGHEKSQSTATAVRTELIARLSPAAFTPDGAALVEEGNRYRSWWRRVLGFLGWRAVQTRLAKWYPHGTPTTSELLGDLPRLQTYHRAAEHCAQVRQSYAADLWSEAENTPTVPGTLQALRFLADLPPSVRTALAKSDCLDVTQLSQAVGALQTAVRQLHEDCTAVVVLCSLPPETLQTQTCNQGAEWVGRQLHALEGERRLVQWLTGLAPTQAQTPAREWLTRISDFLALANLLSTRATLERDLAPLLAATPSHSWQHWCEPANWLLAFLAQTTAPLSPGLVLGLSDSTFRTALQSIATQMAERQPEALRASWGFLDGLFARAEEISTGVVLDRLALPALHQWLSERSQDAERVHEWIRFQEIAQQVEEAGFASLLEEVRAGQLPVEKVGDAFRACFWQQWLDAVIAEIPVLRTFRSEAHEQLIREFRALDQTAIKLAGQRVRHRQLKRQDRPRIHEDDAPPSSELGMLLREVGKKRRHRPLRKLFADIPGVLLRLKPCLMMSPLAVSTYLESGAFSFDVVIFDEASQIRPHDAICAIYRGRQLIVAGDQKQLPPTSFFERGPELGETEGDAGADLSDYESILDVCAGLRLPRRRLRWHYRSHREALIAFSNRHFYDNQLVTFPSVEDRPGNPAIVFEHLAEGRWRSGTRGGWNPLEAARVAQRVLEHFRAHPGETLGVIAFSQRQQIAILDELERQRRQQPELEPFFADERESPFFVKNLENVQGDERDVIFLSVGYGPDETTGRVAMRFGPLNLAGGERRLNVAITRARCRLHLFASLRAGEIDLTRTASEGARLLRAYLDFAEQGPNAWAREITSVNAHECDSPFEQAVAEELQRCGLTIHRQVGCGGFRIDLAVVDPQQQGRYLLGIECDGATYHSSATARDRDRLRQEMLERLGWKICRIWSTDWLRSPTTQVRRVLAALTQPATPPADPSPEPPHEEDALVLPVDPPTESATDVDAPQRMEFPSIDQVPETVLREVLQGTLTSYGAMSPEDLTTTVARKLGFERTGSRIKARVEQAIEECRREGHLSALPDGRLRTG